MPAFPTPPRIYIYVCAALPRSYAHSWDLVAGEPKTMTVVLPLSCVTLVAAISVAAAAIASTGGRPPLGDSCQIRPLSIVLVAPDWSGHSLPFLTLGQTLRDRGHNVSVVTDRTFSGGHMKLKEMCAKAGLTLHSYGNLEAKDVDDEMIKQLGTGPGVFLRMLSVITQTQDTVIEALAARHIDGTDVVVLDMFYPAVAQWLNANTNITVVSFTQALPISFSALPSWHYPTFMARGGPEPAFTQRFTSTVAPILIQTIAKTVGFGYQHYMPLFTPAGIHNPEIVGVTFGFDYPRPLYPMMHYVGPVVSQRKEVLSDDLQVWLDQKSPRSVLYVSTGSMLNTTKQLAVSVVDAALQSKYSILWSIKDRNRDVLDDVDQTVLQNGTVFLSKWLPQAAVLRHPSISVAILHCGLGGLNDALMAGVPIIGAPQTTDQFGNCARIQHQGLGVCLHGAGDITSDLLQSSIKEIESGPHRETIRKLNAIFTEAGGVERAADLIEYYHKVGYSHLVPFWAKHQWSTVQYYNFDVYAAVAGVVVLVVFVLYKCSRCVCRRVCCRGHPAVERRKKAE